MSSGHLRGHHEQKPSQHVRRAWSGRGRAWARVTRHRGRLCRRPTSPGSPPRRASLPRIMGLAVHRERQRFRRAVRALLGKMRRAETSRRRWEAASLFWAAVGAGRPRFPTAPSRPRAWRGRGAGLARGPWPCSGKSRARQSALSARGRGEQRTLRLPHDSCHSLSAPS